MSKPGARKSLVTAKASKGQLNKPVVKEPEGVQVSKMGASSNINSDLSSEDSSPVGHGLGQGVGLKPMGASNNNKSVKRKYEMDAEASSTKSKLSDAEHAAECAAEMNNFMGMLSAAKSVEKRKRLDAFVSSTFRVNQKKVIEPWKAQLGNNVEIAKQLHHLSTAVLDQVEVDVAKMKESDDRVMKLLQQQIKNNEKFSGSMLQRVAACRQINENFVKKAQEQEINHRNEMASAQEDLKQELCALQKQMLSDTQKKEIEHVQKNVAQMFLMSSYNTGFE